MQGITDNNSQSLVGNSGNSDVDVNIKINIDTKAIAYGMLCSLFAKGDLTELELDKAVHKLDKIVEADLQKKKGDYEGNIISNNQETPSKFHYCTQLESRPLLFTFPEIK